MRHLIRIMIMIVPLLATFSTTQAAESIAPPPPSTILIGGIYNLTGYQSHFDYSALKGAMVAVDWVNHHGGVNGHPILLTIRNSQTNINVTPNKTTELAKNPNIAVLVGLSDDTSLAAGMIPVEKYNKLFITCGATSGKLAAAYAHNLILISYTDTMQAEAGALFASTTLHAKNALLISNTSTRYTRNISHIFEQKFKALGHNIVEHYQYSPNDFNLHRLIERIKNNQQRVDLIYLATNSHTLAIIKALRQAGLNQPILSGDGFDDDTLLKNLPANAGSIYFTTHVVLNPHTANGMERIFLMQYYRQYNAFPDNAFTALGFDSILLAVEALRQSHSRTTKSLREVLYHLTHFTGASGIFTYQSSNIPTKNVYVVKVVNHQRQQVGVISNIKQLFYPS